MPAARHDDAFGLLRLLFGDIDWILLDCSHITTASLRGSISDACMKIFSSFCVPVTPRLAFQDISPEGEWGISRLQVNVSTPGSRSTTHFNRIDTNQPASTKT
jgi:hypothetical protein